MMGLKGGRREHGDQLSLGDMLPAAGERWVNWHTKYIATVIGVQQRRYVWVTIRHRNIESEIPLAEFLKRYSRL